MIQGQSRASCRASLSRTLKLLPPGQRHRPGDCIPCRICNKPADFWWHIDRVVHSGGTEYQLWLIWFVCLFVFVQICVCVCVLHSFFIFPFYNIVIILPLNITMKISIMSPQPMSYPRSSSTSRINRVLKLLTLFWGLTRMLSIWILLFILYNALYTWTISYFYDISEINQTDYNSL